MCFRIESIVFPLKCTNPEAIGIKPIIDFSKVDLPAPLGPIKAVN